MIRIEDFIGEGYATAAAVSAALAQAGGGPVEFVINSAGGSAFEGAAILGELRAYRGRKTVMIRGLAASAASLIAMGGDDIVMDRAALIMIHDPAAVTFGDAATHEKSAADLRKIAGVYAATYAEATGHPVSRIAKWMQDETWLTAEEAVALHFADRMEEPAAPVAVAAFDFTRFRHAPAELVALARANGWATVSPDQQKRTA